MPAPSVARYVVLFNELILEPGAPPNDQIKFCCLEPPVSAENTKYIKTKPSVVGGTI